MTISKSQQQIQEGFIRREKQKIYGKPKKTSDYSRKQFNKELEKSHPDLFAALEQRPKRRKFRKRS